MRKLLILLITVMSSLASQGQKSYESLLKEFMTMGGTTTKTIDVSSMTPMLLELNKKLLGDNDKERSEQLVEEYASSQLEQDLMSNILAPIFKDAISEQELQELVTTLKTPEGKQWKEHSDKAYEAGGMAIALSALGVMYSDSKQAKDMTPDEKCPKSYQELFDQYYEKSKIEQAVSTMMQKMVPPEVLQKAKDEKAKKKFDEFMGYIKRNMKPMMLNCAFEAMTTDDLTYGISLFSNPAYSKFIEMSASLYDIKSPMVQKLGMSMLQSYASWLQQKGVTLQVQP